MKQKIQKHASRDIVLLRETVRRHLRWLLLVLLFLPPRAFVPSTPSTAAKERYLVLRSLPVPLLLSGVDPIDELFIASY
ncbi:MAG TPA: hypothetical protein VM843_03940 [Flavisolibacter sp.]|nr:hypothetical protein [Flavisolibacter sp.]